MLAENRKCDVREQTTLLADVAGTLDSNAFLKSLRARQR